MQNLATLYKVKLMSKAVGRDLRRHFLLPHNLVALKLFPTMAPFSPSPTMSFRRRNSSSTEGGNASTCINPCMPGIVLSVWTQMDVRENGLMAMRGLTSRKVVRCEVLNNERLSK